MFPKSEHSACQRIKLLCIILINNKFAKDFDQPRVRFTERGGPKIGFECLRSNPRAHDWWCNRDDCLPCKSRIKLGEKIEKVKENGTKPLPKEESTPIPDCTRENIGYALECTQCRESGIIRRYIRDTSRLAYTRKYPKMSSVLN